MVRLEGLGAIAGTAAILVTAQAAHGSCSLAGNAALAANTLYLVYPAGNLVPLRRAWPARIANPSVTFVDGIRLLYVIDVPGSEVARRTSGALAVRLVSTSPRGPQSSHVRLKRDSVDTRRSTRPAWTGRVRSRTYYNFHNPGYLPASDSYLQREFHTNYVYIAGSPERSTYSNREQFHFPEMSGTAATGFFPRFLGGNGYVEAADKRYEAQIKYYRLRSDERCVLIRPDLQSADSELKITISDLDRGTGADWRILWSVPTQ